MIVLAMFAAQAQGADANLSLPLQGHYRPGRYMPVRISAQLDSPGAVLTLSGTGALSTEIPAVHSRIDAIIPWLSVRTIREVAWSSGGTAHPIELPLHALDEDERLIAFAGADPDALAITFAGKKLVRVPLDIADALPGDISAWGSLDGLVLDVRSAMKLKEGQLRNLLAGGTAIGIRTAVRPKDRWPWKQQGAYWICRLDIAGPTSAYVPEAYAPTQTWLRGWPAGLRRQVLLAAIVFVVLLTTITLWRSRWMVVAGSIVCIISTAAAVYWRVHQSPAIEIQASAIILSPTYSQRDSWTYRAALREMDGTFDLGPPARPVFGYRQQADGMAVRQLCADDGRPLAVRYHLKPRQSIAFQARSVQDERINLNASPAETSTWRALVDQMYVLKDDRIVGQIRAVDDEHWADVVVDRPAKDSFATLP